MMGPYDPAETLPRLIKKIGKGKRIHAIMRADNYLRHDGFQRDQPFGTDGDVQ